MKSLFRRFREIGKLVFLLLSMLVAFSYAMFQGGFVSWFLLYSFLPFALYALGVSLYSLASFRGGRIFANRELVAGEPARVQITLERSSAFPLFYLVVEEKGSDSLLESRMRGARKLVFPGFRKKFTLDYTAHDMPRGEHMFQGLRLQTGDLLGLVEKERVILLQDKILVYPSYEEMVYRPFENRFDQGAASANERIQRDATMSVGVREYQPGDRFSWINWKASAKRNGFMTKEFEQRQSHDVLVLMDCAANPQFEVVVAFTASILRAMLRKGAEVGLLTVSGERVSLPIRGGEEQQHKLLYHLAKIKADSSISFDQVLAAESLAGRQNTLMLVTAKLTEELIDKAAYSSKGNGSVTIFLAKNSHEHVSQSELSLKAAARSRAVRVFVVHEGHFAEAFAEVVSG
jgi:uncharacterized protein (DUF58 family)